MPRLALKVPCIWGLEITTAKPFTICQASSMSSFLNVSCVCVWCFLYRNRPMLKLFVVVAVLVLFYAYYTTHYSRDTASES